MSRSIAQESVSWYFSHLDERQSHTINIQTVFRGPVIALTASILSSPLAPGGGSNGAGTEAPTTGRSESPPLSNDQPRSAEADVVEASNSIVDPSYAAVPATGSNWREYLTNESIAAEKATENFHLKDAAGVYGSLSKRAQARLNAFLEGVCLAVDVSPPKGDEIAKGGVAGDNQAFLEAGSTSFGLVEGLAGFRSLEKNPDLVRHGSSQSSGASSAAVIGSKTSKKKVLKKPQISEAELVFRLELYIRTLQRCHHLGRDCVVSAESNRSIKARAQFVVVNFVDTVGTVRQQGPILTRLLSSVTKELLAVSVLSEDLVRVIRRIVSNYVHTTSFASLAFLSSPETAAETRLKPSVLQYLKYLQQNWQDCELECDLESMLSTAVDPMVRNTFKTIEFHSIGHLLEVCQGFRNELRNIQLPPCSSYNHSSFGEVDDTKVQQALRDLKREIITVNGHVLPPVGSRTDLIQLLSQTLNSRALSDPGSIAASMSRKKKKKSRRNKGKNGSSDIEGIEDSDSKHGEITSATENTDEDAVTRSQTPAQRAMAGRRSFRLSTVDLLTKRLLLAAGRTGAGGDAYFVVRDLFGGSEVEVVPSKSNILQNSFYRPMASAGTIDLIVKLTSVTIKCHASFDIYPKNMVGEGEPLIQVHTTTTETIELQEVRLSDLPQSGQNELRGSNQYQPSQLHDGGQSDSYASEEESINGKVHADVRIGSLMVVQERKTEKSGYRTLSIRPAVYEKVEVFNTPS